MIARFVDTASSFTTRDWVATVVLLLLAVFVGLPFVWMVTTSFQPGKGLTLPPTYIPDNPSLQSYVSLFESRVSFLKAYWNSIFIAVMTTLGVLVSSTMAAFAFSRLEFRGRGALFVLILMSLMVPGSFLMIPLFFQFAAINILDSIWALIVPTLMSPFGVFMLRQFMVSQPVEYEEAALVEGASYWSIFRRVSLPQMAPAIASLTIITFTASWNNFLLPLVFVQNEGQMTLPLAILTISTTGEYIELSGVMAGVVLSFAPLFFVFLFAQRFFVEGLTNTGMKS